MPTSLTSSVVITGIGAVTALGTTPEELLSAVERGVDAHGLAANELIPADLAQNGERAKVLRINGPSLLEIGGLKPPFPDRSTLLGVAAVDSAVKSSRLPLDKPGNGGRVGCVGTTSFGPRDTVEKYMKTLLAGGPGNVSPIAFSRTVANAVLGEICRRHGLFGASTMLVGGSAVEYGFDLLQDRRADAVVCVGVDTLADYTPWTFSHASLLLNGMVLAEAAAALILEQEESAIERGAVPLARILATASCFSPAATLEITHFDPDSICWSMLRALERARASATKVDLIISVDNGDTDLRATELEAIARIFGRSVETLRPKRAFGETFGAAEPLSVAIAALHLAGRGRAGLCLVISGHLGGAVTVIILECASA
jgi:3-oxoacyl-[acyl-carrier-protein] synthase II